MEDMEMLQRPVLELFGDRDAGEIGVNLLGQVRAADAALGTARVPALAAMVVGVLVALRSRHLLDSCPAAWAGIAIETGELVVAVVAPELVFLLGRHHPATLPATDEPGEREIAAHAGTGVTFASQKHLDAVIFGMGHHRRMVALVPLAPLAWQLEPAVVEWIGENLIGASTHHFPKVL